MSAESAATRFRTGEQPSFAPMVVAVRSGLEESLHHGAAVALDGGGRERARLGDPDLVVYPRSALKPLQAAAMVELGLDVPARMLALVAASHSGEAAHVAGVVELLELHGLDVTDLGNTPALPYGDDARAEASRAGRDPTPLTQNCSGKHAGMLAVCRLRGWPTDDYLAADHPLQVAITRSIEARGVRVRHVGVDGCGAPTHAVSLRDLARGIGELARSGSVVTEAMSAHPDLVGGTGRDVTAWMAAVPGLVAKEGAAGVMVLARADGGSVALKVADGSDAARQAATVEGLRRLGVDVDGSLSAVTRDVGVPVLGHGRPVGELGALRWASVH